MNKLDELVETIKKQPSLYLGKHSIVAFKAFLAGYIFAQQERGEDTTELEQRLSSFERWIHGLGIGKGKSDRSWDKIILLYSEDEISALDRFFRNYEHFQDREKLKKTD